MTTSTWTTLPVRPDDPDATILLREYMEEMVRRYHRHPARPGEVEAAVDRIRLDTRADLVEARALYARHGYVEIPAYNADRYAEHWFEKMLAVAVDDASRSR